MHAKPTLALVLLGLASIHRTTLPGQELLQKMQSYENDLKQRTATLLDSFHTVRDTATNPDADSVETEISSFREWTSPVKSDLEELYLANEQEIFIAATIQTVRDTVSVVEQAVLQVEKEISAYKAGIPFNTNYYNLTAFRSKLGELKQQYLPKQETLDKLNKLIQLQISNTLNGQQQTELFGLLQTLSDDYGKYSTELTTLYTSTTEDASTSKQYVEITAFYEAMLPAATSATEMDKWDEYREVVEGYTASTPDDTATATEETTDETPITTSIQTTTTVANQTITSVSITVSSTTVTNASNVTKPTTPFPTTVFPATSTTRPSGNHASAARPGQTLLPLLTILASIFVHHLRV